MLSTRGFCVSVKDGLHNPDYEFDHDQTAPRIGSSKINAARRNRIDRVVNYKPDGLWLHGNHAFMRLFDAVVGFGWPGFGYKFARRLGLMVQA